METRNEQMFGEMLTIAEQYPNIELDKDVGMKIAKFRVRTGMPITKCPCDPQSSQRGCIGKKCMEEITKDGICHCMCYKTKGLTNIS